MQKELIERGEIWGEGQKVKQSRLMEHEKPGKQVGVSLNEVTKLTVAQGQSG